MVWRLLELADFNPDMLILKKPVYLGQNDNGKAMYRSEIWYKDPSVAEGKPFRPIFKSPRLKVHYSCKRFTNGISYCISNYNSDIDDDIAAFFDLVKNIERRLNILYRQLGSTWDIKFPSKKFWSSVKKTEGCDTCYMQIKVITNKPDSENAELEPVSKINHNNGAPLAPEEIKYGCFSEQLLSISYLFYCDDGIRPVWYTHQTVLSRAPNVFLDYCLLNDNWASQVPRFPAPPPPPPYPPSYPPSYNVPPPPPLVSSFPTAPPLSFIKQGDLLKAIGKLKSTKNIPGESTVSENTINDHIKKQKVSMVAKSVNII